MVILHDLGRKIDFKNVQTLKEQLRMIEKRPNTRLTTKIDEYGNCKPYFVKMKVILCGTPQSLEVYSNKEEHGRKTTVKFYQN